MMTFISLSASQSTYSRILRTKLMLAVLPAKKLRARQLAMRARPSERLRQAIYCFGHCLNIFLTAFCTSSWFLLPLLFSVFSRDAAPHQRLLLRVVQADNHRGFDVLLRADSAHAAADSAHAPRVVRGLLVFAAAGGKN